MEKIIIKDRYNVNNGKKNIFNNVITVNPKIQEKQSIALYLVDKFNDEKSLEFYLKVAWSLPRGRIEQLAGEAKELGKNPARYFTFLAKKEMAIQNS